MAHSLLLAVEILSPSTRDRDVGIKLPAHAQGGVPHYWLVEPGDPSIVVFELQNGAYQQASIVKGEEFLDLRRRSRSGSHRSS